MARLARMIVPHHAHIVTIRALEGVVAFPDASAKQAYIDLLRTYCEKHQCALLAYAVLDARATMVMVPRTANGIGKVMQSVGRFYVQHYNQRHEHVGTLWDGRYRCAPVGFLETVHQAVYAIEHTPVHSGAASDMSDYAFSSHHQNVHGHLDAWVLSDACTGDVWQEAKQSQERYTAFCARSHSFDKSELLDTAYKGWVVGTETYIQLVETLSGRRSAPRAKGGDRRSAEYRLSKGLPAKPSILKKKKRVKKHTKIEAVTPLTPTQGVESLSSSDVLPLTSTTQTSTSNMTQPEQSKDTPEKTTQNQPVQDSIVQGLASMEEMPKPNNGVGGADAKQSDDTIESNEPVQGSLF